MAEEYLNNQLLENEAPERPDYSEEIEKIIQDDTLSLREMGEKLEDYHENDIADVLPNLSSTERKKLYHVLGKERTSEIFAYLDDASKYLEELDAEFAADIVESMDADDAIDVLEDLDEEKRTKLVELLEEDAREDIQQGLFVQLDKAFLCCFSKQDVACF